MNLRTQWPLLAAALVALLALVETGNALTAPGRAPRDADWAACAADVRAQFHVGEDLLAIAPAWADPVGRKHLGDLMPVSMIARADDDGWKRLWVVSTRGAQYEGPAMDGATVEEEREHGRVRWTRYRLAPAIAGVATTFDFTARLADARVTEQPRDGRGEELPCYRAPEDDDDGSRCGGTHVGRRTLEIDYRPRRGILVPVDNAQATRLEWQGVPLGPGTTIVAWAGMHDYYARKSGDGPVHLAVVVDDTRALDVDLRNADGWRRFAVDGARWPGAHTVRFEVSSPQPAWRNLGLAASVRTGITAASPTGAGT